MKKLLSFIVLTLTALSMMAKPVDPDKAMQVAKNFVAQYVKDADQLEAVVVYTHPMPKSGQPAMYVVNLGSAFVIVSADDVAHPVLGYSLSRPWPTQGERSKVKGETTTPQSGNQTLAPQVAAYLDDLAAQIEAAILRPQTSPSASGKQTAASALGTQTSSSAQNDETAAEWHQLLTLSSSLLTTTTLPDSVGPLLTTTWGQGQYYNALCPEDINGIDGHCATGCVATAMAQIINYWGYPVHGRGTHSYQHDTYGTLTVNYDNATYDYAHMPDALTATSTPQEVNAVATLMRDCGVAVTMSYGPYESGADGTVIASALVDYFRMNPRLGETSSSYYTGEQWIDLLKDNMSRNQPVLYSNGSHEYILDGFNSEGYFHFNMGWGGSADGWYLLDTFYNYTAIVDIRPDSSSNIIIGQSYGTSSYFVDSTIHFKHVYAESDYPHSVYTGGAHPQIITFQLQDTSEQIVVDFMSYEEKTPSLTMVFYDGGNTSSQLIRTLDLYGSIDKSPIVASGNQITIYYTCVHADAGFHLRIGGNGNCRVVSNVIVNESAEIKEITWTENGTATQWMVEYGETGFAEGAGLSTTVDTAYVVISGLSPETTYDVRIRPVCTDNASDLWRSITVNNRKYWTDVVLSEPEGYYIDSVGTIHISTAEGLAWLAKLDEALNWEYIQKNIVIENDIDLGQFLWRPMLRWKGNVDGKGHVIRNMTVREISAENGGGLFVSIQGDTVKDLGFVNADVDAPSAGAFSYSTAGNTVFLNCFSVNHTIKSSQFEAGGLLAASSATLINCFVTGKINPAFTGGGIVSDGAPKMYNCYSSVREISGLNVWKGLITAYTRGGEFDNCFADIDYVKDNWSGAYMGSYYDNPTIGYFFGRPEGISRINNAVGFTRKRGNGAILVTDTAVSCTYPEGTTLINALNGWVIEKNDPSYRTWAWDSVLNLPVFGSFYEPMCPGVSNIVATNIMSNGEYTVALSWQENGSAEAWHIKCLPTGIVEEDSAIYYTANTTLDTLWGLTLGKAYDFYVRPICTDSNTVPWGTPATFIVDKPYWVEMVTSCPAGYYEDNNGNVTISSAEGLAWMSIRSNGLHGQKRITYEGKTVSIVADIDMGRFRWTPISLFLNNGEISEFRGRLDGKGHTISNIYCNEIDIYFNYLGLFGYCHNANLSNLVIADSKVIGTSFNGILVGVARSCSINNCHVRNSILKGNMILGGLVAEFCAYGSDERNILMNSSSTGTIWGDQSAGGLFGYSGGDRDTIINCYSGMNIAINGLYYPEALGSLMAYSSGVIKNCYSHGYVERNDSYSTGSAIGTIHPNCVINNVYGIHIDSVPLFGYIYERPVIIDTATISNAGFLEPGIPIGNSSYTDLLSALNAWVDANDTTGLYRYWAVDSANVNGGFPVFAEPQSFTLTLNVDENTPYGSVSGGGSYSEINKEATIIAISQEQYHFVQWNDGNTDNPRVVVLTQDTSFTAQFEADRYSIVGTASMSISYADDFENPAHDNQWTLQNDNYVNQWHLATLNDTNRALFISNDNGVSNNYTINGADSYVFAYTYLTLDAGQYNYSYDWRCNAEQNYDYLRVALVPVAIALNYNEWWYGALPVGSIALDGGTQLVQQTDWTIQSGTVDVPSDGEYRLVFYWCNDNPYGYMPPAAIDNIHFSSTVMVEDHGVVLGSDTVPYLDTVTLTAIPDEGYHFTQWKDGNTDNPRTIIVTEDAKYIAFFEKDIPIGNDTILVCDSYTWNGIVYTSDTVLVDTISTSDGDSISYHHLFVNYSTNSILTDTACEAYFWDGEWRYISGQYADTTTNAVSCDSIAILNLTINNPVHTATTVTVCDSYTWQEAVITTSGTYHYTHTDANGCTQDDTLYLTVNYSSTGDTMATACDSFTWWNTNYTSSTNTPIHVYTNTLNCDSTVTLHLTINHSNTGDTTATACDSFTWWNTNYTSSTNTPIHVYTNTLGCDSTATLNLTINYSSTGDTSATACDSYSWYEHTDITESTDALTHTFADANAQGCDSIVTLHLTINYSTNSILTDTACEAYFWDGEWRYISGQYFDTTTNAVGCDSIAILNLTINNPVHTATTVTACDNYTWQEAVITTSGTYHYTHTDANGCTQDDTLYLTVNYSSTGDTSATACDNFAWYEHTNITESTNILTHTLAGANAQGCDSTVTLHLTINYSSTGDTTATACDSFTWWNTNYTSSTNTPIHVYTNTLNCDSTVTLHLTINHSVETTVTDSAEESYAWHDSTYTESGTYQWIGNTVEGCDSIVTLILTIIPSHEGIDEWRDESGEWRVRVENGRIVVENLGNADVPVRLYDMMGRRITTMNATTGRTRTSALPGGVYLVKIGNAPAKKVVVIRNN